MRDPRFGLIRLVLSVVVAAGAALWPASLPASNTTCDPTASATDPGIPSIFSAFTNVVNALWTQKATTPPAGDQPIDPLKVQSGNLSGPCPSDGGTKCFFGAGLTNCKHSDFHVNFSALTGPNGATGTGLATVKFGQVAVAEFKAKDVAAHSASGPEAGKITDGVYAPEGTAWNDARAVVLPLAGPAYALTVDLGSVMTLCANAMCGGPRIQADGNDQYLLEYSTDGSTWLWFSNFYSVSSSSSSGLRTRDINFPCCNTFNARYLRVYPDPNGPGDGKYSIAELEVHNTSGGVVSSNASAVGPLPAQITSGNPPPAGTVWNDPRAVILANVGPAHALVVNLGGLINVCGNGWNCKGAPVVQADYNDTYQIDYSTDGTDWKKLNQVPPSTAGTGLRNHQNSGCDQRPNMSAPCSATNANPNVLAQYVRVWAVSGDGNYSVSQIQIWNTASVLVSNGKPTYGPEPFITNGEMPDDGTTWNDPRYARVLPACTSTNNANSNTGPVPPAGTKCLSTTAKSAAVVINLGASFPVSQLNIQADGNDTYQVDYLNEHGTWAPLWTFGPLGSHLTTRASGPINNVPMQYLRVYATAGDGSYSVSELQVFTSKASTACAYDAFANALAQAAGQSAPPLSCSYDGEFTTAVELPPAGLLISFTVDEVCGNLRCTNGTSDGSTDTECVKTAKCGAVLTATQGTIPQGTFCSGTCASGNPSSVLTYGQLNESPIQFQLSQLSCDKSLGDFGDAVTGVVQAATASAVQALFNGFLTPPAVPSAVDAAGNYVTGATCKPLTTAAPAPNATLQGRASRVGAVTDSGSVRVSGQFTAPHAIDLHRVSLVIDELLDEMGGAGELARNVAGVPAFPIRVEPRSGSTATATIYQSPSGLRPNVRAEVKTRDPNRRLIEFSITVDRTALPTEPSSCNGSQRGSARLATKFGFEGPAGRLASAIVAPTWRCLGSELATP